jgi:hypothetical protein
MSDVTGFKIPESFAEYLSMSDEEKMDLWKQKFPKKRQDKVPEKRKQEEIGDRLPCATKAEG